MVKKTPPMMSSSDTKHRFSLSVEGGEADLHPKILTSKTKTKTKQRLCMTCELKKNVYF